ncbi:MAG: endonuclease/exonuclease/phosphatase family protein [Rhodocyclaceae bacterium]|nr:endonuclease/exonuclease/phosphatase family protein [Pseudomonadota bacterium]MDQ7970946.1 endonuclease/exonuclease/phosphatase family protein [Rhodocyclaceae bacterium]MDQ7998825.1 endonuclease/exonuclease/phosphatase family protein [Pseudomonadota bacterium]MDQ8015671.1 endonuclease/exonuclease/phosphatase family protein [Pseudomonadota bacterium]
MQDIPPNFATLFVATCNLLNLARPQRIFYANQDPYDPRDYQRKVAWLGERFRVLNADVLAVQEVWDDTAFKDAVLASGLRYDTLAVPGAESAPPAQGAQGTPRVGIATRLRVDGIESFVDFPDDIAVDVPGLGLHTRFERPPLLARLRMKHGQPVNVLTVHLKSKRPKFLLDAAGQSLEDRDDRKVAARASLRSLLMRGAEAAALRCIVIDLLRGSQVPLVVMGDFNDHPHSVTSQLVAATSDAVYDKSARDVALFNAYEMQGESALKKDVAYSHVHQGFPEILDQVFVSEEFMAGSPRALGDVRRVDYFNDHLHEGRDRTRSDHGFVRALLRLRIA